MPKLSSELVTKFSALQPSVWQSVTQAITEVAGMQVNFNDPLTVATDVADLYTEMSNPKLIIQFAFSDLPESSQVILVGQDILEAMYQSFTGKSRDTIDDTLVSELRPMMESIVQGLCYAAGTLRNEAIVASGLSIRFQIFSFPANMQSLEELVRTNVRVSGDDINGNVVWLADENTVKFLCKMDGAIQTAAASDLSDRQGAIPGIEETGMELLLDIPLEVCVELGRVRMMVKDVIDLGSGSIVEIDKAAGEPVDVKVNGRLVARGEVVVIEDNFGVRITEILSPADRLNKIGEVA